MAGRKTVLAQTAVSAEGAIVEAVKEQKSGVRSQESAVEAAAATAAAVPEPDNPLPTSLSLTPEQLQIAIKTAVNAAVGEATAGLQEQVQALRATNTQLTEEKTGLEQVFKVLGKAAPNVNTHLSSGRDRVEGLARDFLQACESAPCGVWVNPGTGRAYLQRDLSDAKRLFWSEQSQLRADMEVYARDHGLLRGRGITASQAATARADIPPALLDYLSMVMRETHRGRYIYWQFPFYKLELGKGPRDTIQVPRLRWIPGATAVGDRILTSAPLTANRQPVIINAVSLTLQECGLGSGNPNNSQPVAVPEFLVAYSMINLEAAVTKVLGNDYEAWEDLAIRSRYFATTRVVYNNSGRVVTDNSSFTVNTDATVTEMFLNNLYAYLSGLQIPPLDDGCYVFATHDLGLAQLKNSLGVRNRYLDKASIEELTAILQVAANREQGRCMGYAGSASGFHIFSSNAHSMGAPGFEGVTSENTSAGNRIFRASVAFGQAAVARAQGMEAEIRQDAVNDFGRLESFTWLSHETTGDLDVDPAINPEQQLRVVEIRTTDMLTDISQNQGS